MEDILYDFPEYTIAIEGFSISNIKSSIANLIRIICDAMQRLNSWITSKFCNFLNIDMIEINQDYYNEIMNTIAIVINIDLSYLSKLDISINVLRNNPDKVKEICGKLQKKVDDLRLLAENIEKISPSEYGKTIQVSTTKIKHLKLTFSKMSNEANSQIYKLRKLKNNPDDIEMLKYTQAQLTMIGHMAAINCMKSNICMRLLDRLMENVIKKENVNEEQTNMNNYTVESFISFCDDMQIVEEGFSEYKKIYRKHKKDISILDKEYHAIPEDTIINIEKKRNLLNDILSQIEDGIRYMNQVTPNTFDKCINALAIIVDGMIGTIAAVKMKSQIGGFDLGSPEIYHTLKNIAFLIVSTTSIKAIYSKGTLAGKKANRNELCSYMSISYEKYMAERQRLNTKKKELENTSV